MSSPRRPTLQQVAERAGVSIGTASGVFSQRPSVSEEARLAVLHAAEELGYSPRRRRAPALDGSGVSAIGLVAQASHFLRSSNAFYSQVLHGAQQACTELGLRLASEVLEDPGGGPTREMPLLAQHRQVQGLLLIGEMEPAYVEAILRAGSPCVLVNHWVEELPVDSVRNEDERGGYLATRYLLERGHVDPVPAMISGPGIVSVREREAGYHRALRERGLQPAPGYLRHGDLAPELGHARMLELLDLPVPPTAVFCCNDTTAFGAMRALHERGLTVPDDCSVISYDDIEMAAHSAPPLTTVQANKELMGAQALWHLLERIRRPQLTRRSTRLDVTVVERASVAPRRPVPVSPAGTGSGG